MLDICFSLKLDYENFNWINKTEFYFYQIDY
jgi:hypothetical protein